MKRIFAFILAALLLFAVPASASDPERLETYFACFYDGHKLASLLGRPSEVDSIFIELFITNDDHPVYFSKKVWSGGVMEDYGMIPMSYADGEKMHFTLFSDDGTVYPCCWGDDFQTLWIDIGAGYFECKRIKELDFLTEVSKEK